MNIIAKNLKGGGGKTLSFLLAAAVATTATLAASAMTTTYYQVKEKQDSTAIKIDGIASDIEIGYEPQLAFPGKTLDDINRCTLITELDGGEGDNTVSARATAWGLHPQRHKTNNSVDVLAYQFGASDENLAKAVVLVLTNGDGGVYVQKFGWCYHSTALYYNRRMYGLDGSNASFAKAQTAPTSSGTSGGYKAWGLRIHGVKAVPDSSLAFPGATLEDLKECAFVAGFRMADALDNPVTNNWAAFKTCWTNTANDKLEKIVMQFDAYESPYTKTAIIQLVDGTDGVWASQPCYYYKKANTVSSQKFSIADNGTVSKISDGSGGNCSSGGEGNYSVSELYAIPQCVKNTSAIKVFSDPSKTLTLDDIKYGSFTARLGGSAIPDSFLFTPDSAIGYNKKLYADEMSGSITNIIVEYQILDKTTVKCVVVSFESGANGIYAKVVGPRYSNTLSIGSEFYTSNRAWTSGTTDQYVATPAETHKGNGYAICDVRVTVPTIHSWTLDTSKTWTALSGGVTPASDEVVRITVTDPAAVLTVNEDVEIAGIEFVDGSGATLLINSGYTVTADSISGIGNIVNNGTLVKTGDGTVAWPFDNASTGVTTVNNGTLKVAGVKTVSNNPYGFKPDGENQEVRVARGATFDLNGIKDLTVSVRLADGGTFANRGAAIDHNKMQTVQIILDGNATAAFSNDFGLLAPGFKETKLDLGSNTLTLDGPAKKFWLCNTAITGMGTIRVKHGYLNTTSQASIGEDCTLEVPDGGALVLDANLTVKNFVNGTINNIAGNAMLTVKGTLTPGTKAIPRLTLVSGATIKATGTAQVVSTTFSASGTIKVDASAITKDDLKNAANERIPVLTVPFDFNEKGVNWVAANSTIPNVRVKWEIDEGGKTKTLYLCRSSGTMIIVR